jgi:hypothetical protein
MPIRVTCPSCQSVAVCPDEYRGRSLRCKKCGRSFVAGAPAPRRPEPAAPPAPRPAAPAEKRPRGRFLTVVLLALFVGVAAGLPTAFFLVNRPGRPDGVAAGPGPTAPDTGPAPADTGKPEPPRDAGTKPPAAAPVVWHDFTSRDWGFSVRFPGSPKVISPPSAGGRRTQVFAAAAPLPPDGKQGPFTVTCTECDPRETADAAAFLAAQTAAFARQASEKTPLKLDGFPGVELRGERKDADGRAWVTVQRVYVVRSRLYNLYVSGPRDEGASDLFKSFFDSFTLLDGGAAAPPVARTPRDRALDWLAEHAAAPADKVVDEAKKLLDARAKDGTAFTLALGEGLLKGKKPVLLVGWGSELLAVELAAEQARALKVAERDIAVAAYQEPAGQRSEKPPFALSDLKISGTGSKLSATVAYRRGEAAVVRVSYLTGSTPRVQREPVEAKTASGTLTFGVSPPASADPPPGGPVVLVVEVCSAAGADKPDMVLSNAVAAVVTLPAAPPKGGLAELQLTAPAGWEARYNKFQGGVGGWAVTKPPPTALSEAEQVRVEECPADARSPADYAAHLKDKDFLNVDLPGWVEVGPKEDLPDGFVFKGVVKKYAEKKTPPVLGLLVVRDIAGLKVRCFSANLRGEKSRDEALEIFKAATFGPAK